MKNLILALNQANLSPDKMESVLTEREVWIDSKVGRAISKNGSEGRLYPKAPGIADQFYSQKS